jgi:hypothetical protein
MKARTAAADALEGKDVKIECAERRWGVYVLTEENAGSEKNKKGEKEY